MNATDDHSASREEFCHRKRIFDGTWTFTIVLAAASACLFRYLGLGPLDVSPVIATLAAIAALQFLLNWWSLTCSSVDSLRFVALFSQLLGISGMDIAWHLFGGIQQPMFPLFIMLPLFGGALLLSFWQQQMSILLLLGVLLSAVILSPDTNSFIEERYGVGFLSPRMLPAWIPKSRVAFST